MMKCLVMLMLAMASSLQADAQLKNLLKNAASEALGNMSHENGTAEALGKLTSKLLGTDTLDAKHLMANGPTVSLASPLRARVCWPTWATHW